MKRGASTNAPPPAAEESFQTKVGMLTNALPPAAEESLQTEASKRAKETTVAPKEQKPNEIVSGSITYSGILVEALKVDNPLELINPLAPPEYGSPEDNVVRDPINGKVSGLNFFSIQF